ncbi:N/A [soil metagenome]
MLTVRALNRFQAFGLHLLASAIVAALSAALVYMLWYPGMLAYASGVSTIFLLLVGVDVVLGPVITLIVFNTKKKELKRDLTIVVLIQVCALLYGLHTVFIARPVYLAFNSGRFDVVNANELSDENLAKAVRPEFRSLPYFGPKVIASPLPDDPAARETIIAGTLTGHEDVQQLPQYYLPYAEQKSAVISALRPLDRLKDANKNKLKEVDALTNKYASMKIDVGYVLLKAKSHDLIVIVNKANGEILEFCDFKAG